MAYNAGLPAPTFDLDAWQTNYTGPLLPYRLAHIALNCPPLSQAALSLAIATAKAGKNPTLHNNLLDLARRLNRPSLATPDTDWSARTLDANKRELARLEQELKGYKNNLIRESIRMGQEDLASHHLATGGPPPSETPNDSSAHGLAAAYAAYAKMRDYCTTPTHIASMTLRLLLTSALQAVSATQLNTPSVLHWNALLANSNRLRSSGVKEEEMARLLPIACAAAGIAHLGQGNYKEAATTFLTVPFDLTTPVPAGQQGIEFTRSIAGANDIAIYGGLTCLATLSREDLTTKVLGGSFRAFLELEPHMRKAISLFTTAKYRACLDTLQRYYADWSLDVFLGAGIGTSSGSHVDRLFAKIREKSIVAYFGSFSAVSFSSLVETFPPLQGSLRGRSAEETMEEEVVGLIESGVLNGRVDVVKGLVVAPRVEGRGKTRQDVVEAAREVERTLLLRLARVNVELAGLGVQPKGKGDGGGLSGWGRSATGLS